jgi:hypothetical protein
MTTSMFRAIASDYIRSNFRPNDRLAVVLVNQRTHSVIQRIATAEKIAAPDFQSWLRRQNAERNEVYISMNTLREDARSRTKTDIAAIRHIYLDFDKNGSAAVDSLFKRDDLPPPSFVLNTSPDKWQVIWKVEGFGRDEAERLQKALARESGADPAATDCARVLRLPGFYNHKYAQPYLVRVEPHAALSGEIYRPEQFPAFPADQRALHTSSAGTRNRPASSRTDGELSQSERDWSYAKRALTRGEPQNAVIAAIASYRRYDKHNPQYYAELTVRKAAQAINVERSRSDAQSIEPER